MLHLSTERLATLVDESPTPAELAHLTSCADCTRERAMYRSLADLAASESTRIGAPLTFRADTGDEYVRRSFGEAKYGRLVALKDKYDPDNLFRLNQNIAPTV